MRITKNYSEVIDFTGGDVLATPEYFKTLGASDWGYLVEDEFVLPFYIKKKFIFNYLLFTLGIKSKVSKEKKQHFLNCAVDYIKANLSVDFILTQHVTALFDCYPTHSTYCSFGSYILDLTKSEEELFAGLHTKHRNVIKKAEKDGVLVSCDMDNKREQCISLIQDTLVRQRLVPVRTSLLEGFSKVCQADYWIAEYNGEVQGAAIILWTSQCCAYYMFGGSCSKPHSGAMNLLHWTAIRKMKERDVRYYDFVGARINPEEGSKYEGIQRFKSRFGGELAEGYLWKIPIRKFKYRLFCWLLALKQKGNYKGDIIDQERRRGNY